MNPFHVLHDQLYVWFSLICCYIQNSSFKKQADTVFSIAPLLLYNHLRQGSRTPKLMLVYGNQSLRQYDVCTFDTIGILRHVSSESQLMELFLILKEVMKHNITFA